MATPFTYDHRLSGRRRIEPVAITWNDGSGGKLASFRRKHSSSEAHIVDMSLTGALIEAPRRPRVANGSFVKIRIDGREGVVRVRRSEPTGHSDMVRYGVDFVGATPELEDRIHDLLDAGIPLEASPEQKARIRALCDATVVAKEQ